MEPLPCARHYIFLCTIPINLLISLGKYSRYSIKKPSLAETSLSLIAQKWQSEDSTLEWLDFKTHALSTVASHMEEYNPGLFSKNLSASYIIQVPRCQGRTDAGFLKPLETVQFFFSVKQGKKLLFFHAELLAGIRSSFKTWLLIPSQAIFQPDNIISWSLTFDIPSTIVRELEHSSFPRNWGTNKSSGGNHHVPRFDWENRGTNFESSVLLHCSGFRQVFL